MNYFINKIILSYFSSRISSFLISDSTINKLKFNYNIKSKEILFLNNLFSGKIDENIDEVISFLLYLSKEFNTDDFHDLIPLIPININNYLEIFLMSKHYNSIEFITNNFDNLLNDLINKLDEEEIKFLITHELFLNISENKKFYFLLKYYNENKNYNRFNLFSLINLDELDFKEFNEYLNIIKLKFLNKETFNYIYKKLREPFTNRNSKLKIQQTPFIYLNKNELKLNISENNSFFEEIIPDIQVDCNNGIINYLRSQSINPIAKSSSINPSYPNSTPDKAIQSQFIEDNDNLFLSDNQPDQWLSINFQHKVLISSYLFKFPTGIDAPSNFDIETSLDGINWNVVDSKRNVDLRGNDNQIQLSKSSICYYIRIKNIGKNIYNNDVLRLYYLEFYGKILKPAN